MKILANGEIVADDDPRVQPTSNNATQRRSARSSNIPSSASSDQTASSSSSWSFGLGSPTADGGVGGGRGGIGSPTNNTAAGGGHGGGNGADARVESVTIFDLINARMIEAGFPRLNLGPYAVEPIAVVGTCVALLLFGLPGLVLSLGLFLAVKFSQSGIPSLAELTGGGAIASGGGDGTGVSRGGGVGRGGRRRLDERGDGSVPDTPKRTAEEDKWGPGQKLGGR